MRGQRVHISQDMQGQQTMVFTHISHVGSMTVSMECRHLFQTLRKMCEGTVCVVGIWSYANS